MTAIRAILGLAAALTVGACSTGYDLTVASTRCDLPRHQKLVGMNIGEVILPSQLRYREIGPGQLVTQEYQPGRLNIFMDAKGWIGRVSCG